jgi:hypothetical protein
VQQLPRSGAPQRPKDYRGKEVHQEERMATKLKENTYEDMHSIFSLAFALLRCRSEKEALQVIKYFARSKSPVPASAKPVRRPDESTEISK